MLEDNKDLLRDHPVGFNDSEPEYFYEQLLKADDPPDFRPKALAAGITQDELDDYTQKVIKDLSGQDYKSMKDCEQHSDLWFQSRKHRITGSMVSGAIGVNPYSNYEKTVLGMIENDFQGNEATKWGNENEDFSCTIYEAAMKKLTTRDDFVVEHRGIVISKDTCYFGASPDGVVPDLDLLLEIKNPYYTRNTQGRHPYAKYQDNIPPYYYSQMQFLMYCLELGKAHFYVWVPANSYITYVYKDQRYIDKMLERADKFFKNVYVPSLMLYERGLKYVDKDKEEPEPKKQKTESFPFV